jgi:hypothetical protein
LIEGYLSAILQLQLHVRSDYRKKRRPKRLNIYTKKRFGSNSRLRLEQERLQQFNYRRSYKPRKGGCFRTQENEVNYSL